MCQRNGRFGRVLRSHEFGLRRLSVANMAAMLDDASMHGPDVLARHEQDREACDWSCSSLSPSEREGKAEEAVPTMRICRLKAGRPHARPVHCLSSYFAGLYQLSRPSCSFLAAASGVSVPLMTLADSTQVSFSRFGVPRDRIW